MNKEYTISDSLELDIKNRFDKVVAHADCSLIDGTVEIKSLYVLQKFRDKGLDDVLLSKIVQYAAEKNAHQIRVYCGPEPFCPDGQIPLDDEIKWYSAHGFFHNHTVFGVVPCMVKPLSHRSVV